MTAMTDVIRGELGTHSCPRCGEAAYLAGDSEDEAYWYCGAASCSWREGDDAEENEDED